MLRRSTKAQQVGQGDPLGSVEEALCQGAIKVVQPSARKGRSILDHVKIL